MSTNFPAALDTTAQLPNASTDSTLTATTHAALHNNVSDSIIAIEQELNASSERGIYEGLRALGGSAIPLMWTCDPSLLSSASDMALTDQRLAGNAMMVNKSATATGIALQVTTAGTSLASYCGGALYSMDSAGQWNFLIDTGGSLTSGGLFDTTGFNKEPFSATIALVPGTLYFAAVLAHWTGTTPRVMGTANSNPINMNQSVYFRNGGVGTRTTRPNTNFAAGSLSAFTNVPWIAVY